MILILPKTYIIDLINNLALKLVKYYLFQVSKSNTYNTSDMLPFLFHFSGFTLHFIIFSVIANIGMGLSYVLHSIRFLKFYKKLYCFVRFDGKLYIKIIFCVFQYLVTYKKKKSKENYLW